MGLIDPRRLAGAVYAVGLPSGEWAALYPGSHLRTHLGRVDLPGFDILMFDITGVGDFKIAGQAQVEDGDPRLGTWEWVAGKWSHLSSEAPGAYPVIYDLNGNLHIATAANGSQGWRYVAEDGTLVTGDDTLNPWRLIGAIWGIEGLWEYSLLGGVAIGQGDPPIGCHVLIDGDRRLLEPGNCSFIRVKYAKGVWTVGITKPDQGVIFTLTRDDLKECAIIDAKPVPVPKEEPPPMQEERNYFAEIEEIRKKYPTPLGPRHGEFLLEAARKVEGNLLRKDWGTFVRLPDGTGVAQDIILLGLDGYDCLQDGDNWAHPSWHGPVEGSPFPSDRVYNVAVEGPSVPTEPVPPQPPAPPIDGDLKAAVGALEARVAALEAKLSGEVSVVLKGVIQSDSK